MSLNDILIKEKDKFQNIIINQSQFLRGKFPHIMRYRKKNHLANLFVNATDDFPSLIPERPKIQQSNQKQSLTVSESVSESTQISLQENSRAQISTQRAQSSALQKEVEVINLGDKTCIEGGQLNESTSISETHQNLTNHLSNHQGQLPQPKITTAQELIPAKKIPPIPQKRQTFNFSWMQSRAVTKVQLKKVAQRIQSTNQAPKLESIANLHEISNNPENQRPLDKYTRQVINLYKKELRKESSDTSGSDHHDGTESEDSIEDPNMLQEIERNHTILEFRLGNIFQKVIRGQFQQAFKYKYSTHYEYSKAKKYTPPVEKIKEIEWLTLGHLKALNINLDLNIQSRGGDFDDDSQEEQNGSKRKTKVYYGDATDKQRAQHFMEIIQEAMFKGVDFILLQEGYQSLIRHQLLELINQLAGSQYGKYFYPENLENFPYSRTTLILSKHPVRFGQLKFEIKDYENQKPNKFYFPYQAFCEFEILVNKKVEKIGILNCHLRSNGERNSDIQPWIMRQKQLDCIHDWGKRQKYDRFFVIGDTNMPSGQMFKRQNIEADSKFVDAYDQGFTPIGGTYLFRNDRNEVVDERMDRVLMNKECADKTVVEIQYEDVLLKSCEGKKLDKKKMLVKYENQLTYITLSDHKLMDITIYMTNKK